MSTISRADLKDQVFLNIAVLLGGLATCDRAGIGAVLVKDGRCVSWGYNGAPPGLPHCDEVNHGMQVGDFIHGCQNATHAEANAVAFAARHGISTDGATLFVSQSPCDTCARLLLAAGIRRVVWEIEYRDPRGLNLLAEAGVELL